jgi:NADH dehydrogenase/NADH:ubiquinone oxidoreductase subunit G
VIVDNKKIEVKEGTTLLQACLDNDIYIPNLCYLDEMAEPPASCRMCFVEIEGEDKPVASCTFKVESGMIVKTDTLAVRRLQRSAFQLLLSVHRVECGPCPANKKCALQQIARFLKVGLKPKRLERFLKDRELEDGHPFLNYYPNRCILCGKCVYVCRKQRAQPHLSFAHRGMDTEISFFGENDDSTMPCENCLACVEVCPVSAITLKNTTYQTPPA